MPDSYIKAIDFYLPEAVLKTTDLSNEFPEWPAEKITSKIGIEERHISGKNEFVSDMAVKAALNLFNNYNISPADIDYILLCTQSPDYFLPTTACVVQDRLGIPISAGALDFNQGCSGYIYGLSLAKGLVAGGIAKNILLITSETYTKYIHDKDKGNRAIFGDAATASLISTDGLAKIEKFTLGSDGSGAANLIVKNGASRNPEKDGAVTYNDLGNPISGDHLFMDGSAIFNFTLATVPNLVKEILNKHDLLLNDVSKFIFHQANSYLLKHLQKKIGIADDRFVIDMSLLGNTVSSTIPIALKRQIDNKKSNSKDKWLLAGFGVGYSWGSCIITFE